MNAHSLTHKRPHDEALSKMPAPAKSTPTGTVGVPLFMREMSTTGGALQRQCACDGTSGANDECATCNSGKFLQAKLSIGASDDPLEKEAERVAERVLAMPANSTVSAAPPRIQRYAGQASEGTGTAPASVDRVLASNGKPLDATLQQDMGQRFGHDFSRVRVHSGSEAEQSARDVSAHAYTVGNNVVFGEGRFSPESQAGRRLLAHELTHVVQQGVAPNIQHRAESESGETYTQSSEMHIGVAGHVVQRFPGEGMLPPGDCGWATYLVLRGSVETAKAVVSTLGACSAGDSCLFLAAKIAAITAEIAARVALDTACFKGGNTGHRDQVQNKINMMNRCYRFFSNSNCPPELIAAMAVVVETARAVIAAAAVVVTIALVVALVAAIVALAEVIAAAAAAVAAAAAEAAAVAAAAAAVIALLVLIKDELAPEDTSGA